MKSVYEPKCFILTPFYCTNRLRYLKFKKCIESVAKQSYKKHIHVIIDDGSTYPDAIKLLDSLKSKKGFKIFRSENQKVVRALNTISQRALELSNPTDLILRLNSDDLLTVDSLELLVNAFRKNPKANAVFSNNVIFYDNWNKYESIIKVRHSDNPKKLWEYLVKHKPFNHLGFCVKAELFKDYGSTLDPDILYSEDWEQIVDIARGLKALNSKPVFIREITYLFRKDDNSLGNSQAMDIRGKIYCYNKILERNIAGPKLIWEEYRNILRIIRIRIGLLFPKELRPYIMPKFSYIRYESSLPLVIKQQIYNAKVPIK